MAERILVCGGRDFNDRDTVYDALYSERRESGELVTEIIEGGAPGADALARAWAHLCGVRCRTFHAAWQLHGRRAGPIRNQRMLDEGKPDLVIAFPGNRGTADMVRRAKAAGVPVREITPIHEERRG